MTEASIPPVNPELITLTIDGKEVSVPKGTNLIEAAKIIGVEIPHYCYHPDLSIAGNCRMCQVKVEGAEDGDSLQLCRQAWHESANTAYL